MPLPTVSIGLIISGLSISADMLQQSQGPVGTTAHCSSNNCHCCYPKRDQTGTKLLPMLPLILEHGSDSSSSAVCSGQVTTRSRPTSMVIAGELHTVSAHMRLREFVSRGHFLVTYIL